jgi:hypothetical protein
MKRNLSLQTELLTCGQQADRFAQAFRFRFLSFGRVYPTDICPPMGGRQPLEILPRACIGLQSFLDSYLRGACLKNIRARRLASQGATTRT